MDKIIQQQTNELSKKKDSLLKKALKNAGYNFETEREWAIFAKENCCIEKHPDGKQVIIANKKPVLEWWENNDIKIKTNPEGTITFHCDYIHFRFL